MLLYCTLIICRAKADYKKAREDSTVAKDLLEDKKEGRIKKEQQEKKMEKQFELIRNLDAHGNTEGSVWETCY